VELAHAVGATLWKGRSPMKKLLSLLLIAGLASLGLGCSGGPTTKPGGAMGTGGRAGRTGDDRSPGPEIAKTESGKPTGEATKPADAGAKDTKATLSVDPPAGLNLQAKKDQEVTIKVARGKDLTGPIELKLEPSSADIKVPATATIKDGEDSTKVKVESTAEKDGDYTVKVSTMDATQGGSADIPVKVKK